jgi:hypothetical protein
VRIVAITAHGGILGAASCRCGLGELRGHGLALERSTPLWYYVLKEGGVRGKGVKLGPVGGRIVGEVIVGLLRMDDESYLTQNPLWKPTLPTIMGSVTGEFRMILRLAARSFLRRVGAARPPFPRINKEDHFISDFACRAPATRCSRLFYRAQL